MISKILSGGFLVLLGIGLLSLPLFFGLKGFIAWIYGLPLFVVGILVLLDRNEDIIEERNDFKSPKSKR
jgi:hypothetical protein